MELRTKNKVKISSIPRIASRLKFFKVSEPLPKEKTDKLNNTLKFKVLYDGFSYYMPNDGTSGNNLKEEGAIE